MIPSPLSPTLSPVPGEREIPGIWITGLGTIGAYGSGAESLRRALASSEPPALSEIDRSAGYHLAQAPRRAYLADPALLREWVPPGEARRMSPPSRFAVATARMALCCAGWSDGLPDEQTGVVVSTAFGPASYSEGLLKQILLEGPESASPMLFMESVANAPAAQIAIACRARGPSVTICQREAGALLAVGQAAADVAAGRVPRALAGGVDEMTPLLHSLLDRFGALARNSGPDGTEIARPLDRRRAGYLASDGATMLLLETRLSAVERGASPLARVAAWGSAFDPTAPVVGWGTGHAGLARSLRRTLERAGIPLERIDRIVTGASGSRSGDRVEALLLREAWGDRPLPPVLAPKSVTGEYGGGFLAAAVLAAGGAPFGPAAGFEEADPELGIVPHDGSLLPPPSTVLVTSVAAGGAASWLVLEAAA
ncbi:MAG TPA: beta-ketoacyl synthase N-terminal-like domain-containing protein [Thermoanaerobaculia bacterium]|nr:beta-ketoacyl synthase N-terminal-like domain-containing protein [Thermoanaerobaculia bacterium]